MPAPSIKKDELELGGYYVVIMEVTIFIIKCRAISFEAENIFGPVLSYGGIVFYKGCKTVPFNKILYRASRAEVEKAKKDARRFIEDF